MSNTSRCLRVLILISTFVGSLPPICARAQDTGSVVPSVLDAKDTNLIYRLDLMTAKLDPINRNDLKIGCIYYHFRSRQNSWAWSYLQNDGSFWYAFGEGTTQIARRFDIRASNEDVSKRLNDFPELARQVEQFNQSVCLRLLPDGRWKIVGIGRLPSIFNVETGERWEKFSRDEYIPVVHTGGILWTVRNGVYYPGSSFSSGR